METKDKIRNLAEELIRTKGYNAFSYADLSAPLKIKNAAIHYHFPSKEVLGASVIEEMVLGFQQLSSSWSDQSEKEQIEWFMDIYRNSYEKGMVCLMGSLAPDFETLSPAMQAQIQRMSRVILDWLTACLEQGRTKQVFQFKGEASDRALVLISSLISSLSLSRVQQTDLYSRIRQQLLSDILA
ncbi:TetR/AcrR family transcriptional regulator [Siphonobacter sp. SORGH_AS_0500]|uniref:TetR/AcrR family transcriptional regulator n=1 Tax=Siphonobacter sp. SORGH_AS_0500 TaxID=1864824 RepID=UPI000CC4DF60|nr:TetR/AcrR family transcriptional regulator [Siphonobacter sp. SORGH_AS_0500]MDR6196859.1 TetR/AcrR family transcriptional repressor of nem operon [Siphonobacter sp. SORGH_AS_0500]PKK35993.1 hypothetical protein BWI96_13250 [Siphonobacter sp. SORGH_AS_0500]